MTHLEGPSGTLKTTIFALALQHFSAVQGTPPNALCSWTDTYTTLQHLAHDCGSSILLIDDLKFDRSVETAEFFFQSQGNLQARMRSGPDQSFQEMLNPRGMVISTGETSPDTDSGTARGLIIRVGRGEFSLAVRDQLQRAANSGLFLALMSEYITWLMPRLDWARAEHSRLTGEVLARIEKEMEAHPRHLRMIAGLLAAYRIFLGFAVDRGLIDPSGCEEYLALASRDLVGIGREQRGTDEGAGARGGA